MDDEMKYSKEALLEEMPLYLNELDKPTTEKVFIQYENPQNPDVPIQTSEKSLWTKIKDFFK